MANAKLDPQYLAGKFFEIDKTLASLTASTEALAPVATANATTIQTLTNSLVRLAIVNSTIAASGGYPDIGAGTIKLLSLDNPAVSESAVLPCYNFKTSSFSANAIIPVVLLNGSYYVITT